LNTDNFFSVDRLVEFGMGMGIAQHMVKSMNSALQEAYLPSAQATQLTGLQPPTLPNTFFVVFDGRQAGPFNDVEISRLVADGRITKSTYVWRAGMLQWEFAENVPEFLRIIALAPPPPPPVPPSAG
jgi:hypothetical protein